MYYPDMSTYGYTPTLTKVDENGVKTYWADENVVNVGWLEAGYEFKTGACNSQLLETILELCEKPIALFGGHHICDFCYGEDYDWPPPPQHYVLNNGKPVYLGNGEIEVTGEDGKRFRAPTLIYHYITEHNYLPPEEFLQALARLDPTS